MLLSRVRIKGYRGISDLSLDLDDICVLIGENNSGKSSILDAVRGCLSRAISRRTAVFTDYDYHLSSTNSEPSKSDGIEITLTFAEHTKGEWHDDIVSMFNGVIQDDNELNKLIIRTSSVFDPIGGDFVASQEFLDLAGNPVGQSKTFTAFRNLQQVFPVFYLASLRDAAQEFRPRSQFWGPFVQSLNLTPEDQSDIEAALNELNTKILKGHKAFDDVKKHLAKTAKLIPLDSADPVLIEAIPSRVFDILSRTQVSLASQTGAQIPIVRHGNGTQSLAVICLFDAFLGSKLADANGLSASPLLAMEEPEAHLHPSAVKAVGEMLRDLSGQKLITTHSGELLAGIPLSKIRRIRRKNGKVEVYQLLSGILTPEEVLKLDYKVRATRGSLMFARVWLLVEGETDVQMIDECARIMGFDLFSEGIVLIEYSQVGLEKFIKLADSFGIEWYILADGDTKGTSYVSKATAQLKGRASADHIGQLANDDMEIFLCMNGYGSVYQANISPQKAATVSAPINSLLYWTQVTKAQGSAGKPECALAVAQKMAETGPLGVPPMLQTIINRARALARSVA